MTQAEFEARYTEGLVKRDYRIIETLFNELAPEEAVTYQRPRAAYPWPPQPTGSAEVSNRHQAMALVLITHLAAGADGNVMPLLVWIAELFRALCGASSGNLLAHEVFERVYFQTFPKA